MMTKAIVVHATGGPEVLQYQDWPVGDPGPGQIRLRQTAVGLNFVDVYNRTGAYPAKLPFVSGSEAAGVVMAVGEGVTNVKEGDRVAYSGVNGAYAEERLMPADRAVLVPDSISDEVAAAIMLKGTTAYYLLHETWMLKAGETILFHAAAGGVGLIACQWANSIGAHVIGTAGGPEKVELARANGFHEVIDYKSEDFVARVKELTGGKGVDVVYDGVGKDTFEGSLDCLRRRGLLVSFGSASGHVSIPNLGVLASKGSLYVTRPTSGSYFVTAEDYQIAASALFDVVASGKVKVTIGKTFALKDAADAHRAIVARETVGSTLLLP
jgi:NADPH2:quinone reductase